jgi:hypothetical protein
VIIDRRSRGVEPIPLFSTHEYFKNEGCWDIISGFFSEEKHEERRSNLVTTEILSEKINTLYAELNTILSFPPKDATRDTV